MKVLVVFIDPLAFRLKLRTAFFDEATHPLPKKIRLLKECHFYARELEEGYDVDFWKVADSLTKFTALKECSPGKGVIRSKRKIRNSLAQYLTKRFGMDPRIFNFNSYLEKVA